jgi:hypothetical protein
MMLRTGVFADAALVGALADDCFAGAATALFPALAGGAVTGVVAVAAPVEVLATLEAINCLK